MKTVSFGQTNQKVSALMLGCMRLNQVEKPIEFLESALSSGITSIDHADIYGGGECEAIFGAALKDLSSARSELFIQSKAGILPGKAYCSTSAYLIQQVEASLERLKLDYLDSFLIHRPDALVEPEQVAEAFYQLEKSGKVRFFGVSNHTSLQIELLKQAVSQPLQANQLQFGLQHTGMIDQGIFANTESPRAAAKDSQIIDYSRIKKMTIQAWSPFQFGFFAGTFIDHPDFAELNSVLQELAHKYGVTKNAIAMAWILRHPANMQVILGTTNQERLNGMLAAQDLILEHNEWYQLYQAAGVQLP